MRDVPTHAQSATANPNRRRMSALIGYPLVRVPAPAVALVKARWLSPVHARACGSLAGVFADTKSFYRPTGSPRRNHPRRHGGHLYDIHGGSSEERFRTK